MHPLKTPPAAGRYIPHLPAHMHDFVLIQNIFSTHTSGSSNKYLQPPSTDFSKNLLMESDYLASSLSLCLTYSSQNAPRRFWQQRLPLHFFPLQGTFPHFAHLTKHLEDSVTSVTPSWRPFQTPLQSFGSTQPWVFTLVSLETRLQRQGQDLVHLASAVPNIWSGQEVTLCLLFGHQS